MAMTDVTLPSGEQITVDVPENWDDAQIRSALVASGEIVEGEAPAATPGYEAGTGEALGFGYVNEPNMIGMAKELIDRKVLSSDDVTTETEVIRQPGVPEDVPVFADDPGAVVEKQTFTQPGQTEEDVQAMQNDARRAALSTTFPELMQDADATRDSIPFVIGDATRVITDLITVPLPSQKVKALSELSKTTKLLGSSAGRRAVAASAVEGGTGVAAFSALDNSLRQLHQTGEIDKDELATATIMGFALGGTMAPVLGAGLGKLMKRFNKSLDGKGADVTAEDILDMAPELTGKEVDDLLVGFDEVAFAAKYEPKAKISMDTNVNAAKAERDGAQSVAEVKREIARAKAHKARTALSTEAEAIARKGEQKGIDLELKTNMNTPRNKDGDIKWGLKFGNGVVERLEQIAAGFSPLIRKVAGKTNTNTTRDVRRAQGFFKHKDYKRMSGADKKTLHTAMADSDGPVIREVLAKYGDDLGVQYEKNVRGLIDEIGTAKAASKKGRSGFVSGYHPREIINVGKARKALGRKDRDALDEALRASQTKKGGRPLNPQETEAVVRSFLKGKAGMARGRRIDAVGEENIHLYEKPEDALM